VLRTHNRWWDAPDRDAEAAARWDLKEPALGVLVAAAREDAAVRRRLGRAYLALVRRLGSVMDDDVGASVAAESLDLLDMAETAEGHAAAVTDAACAPQAETVVRPDCRSTVGSARSAFSAAKGHRRRARLVDAKREAATRLVPLARVGCGGQPSATAAEGVESFHGVRHY
jgi:hypothetical protein